MTALTESSRAQGPVAVSIFIRRSPAFVFNRPFGGGSPQPGSRLCIASLNDRLVRIGLLLFIISAACHAAWPIENRVETFLDKGGRSLPSPSLGQDLSRVLEKGYHLNHLVFEALPGVLLGRYSGVLRYSTPILLKAYRYNLKARKTL